MNYLGVTHCENSAVEIVYTGIWFGFTNVLFRAVIALYHVNDVLRVTVDVMSGLISPVEWNVYVLA